ncbi:type I-E CRISPR-associated protein Cse2/CasB [Streptomyces sp. CA-132043]|uniref:type I-E CRISPR-associated protein Cse2/CasB n=1 Tax=Streptomyces sp. CA-132043 TaxID=3240048 RepID=UPI003D93637A
MATRDEHRQHYDAFVTQIQELCQTPAIRHTLATGRGRPIAQCLDLHKYLSRRTSGHGARRAHYTVAALIALDRASLPEPHEGDEAPPDWKRRPNLGTTLALAVHTGALNAGPTEDHLQLMRRLTADTLHPLLPHLIDHLLQKGRRPDWAVLLEDLAQWDYDRGQVATRWLDAYYLTTQPDPYQES